MQETLVTRDPSAGCLQEQQQYCWRYDAAGPSALAQLHAETAVVALLSRSCPLEAPLQTQQRLLPSLHASSCEAGAWRLLGPPEVGKGHLLLEGLQTLLLQQVKAHAYVAVAAAYPTEKQQKLPLETVERLEAGHDAAESQVVDLRVTLSLETVAAACSQEALLRLPGKTAAEEMDLLLLQAEECPTQTFSNT